MHQSCDQHSIMRIINRDNSLALCPGLCTGNRESVGTERPTKNADALLKISGLAWPVIMGRAL